MVTMVGDAASVQAMEYAEELGDYSNVASIIRLHGEQLEISENADAKERYAKLVERVAPAFEYEKTCGKGSLLKLEKPDNISLISLGLISQQEVEAASRHRERLSVLSS
jgi:3-deoxy-D-arabino-heptulosonate 7-phosphate (DAHP) synthase class II